MKFFPAFMRALAAAAAVAAPLFLGSLVGFFQTFVPSDVATGIWAVLSMVVVFVLNYFIGKLPRPSA